MLTIDIDIGYGPIILINKIGTKHRPPIINNPHLTFRSSNKIILYKPQPPNSLTVHIKRINNFPFIKIDSDNISLNVPE